MPPDAVANPTLKPDPEAVANDVTCAESDLITAQETKSQNKLLNCCMHQFGAKT